MWALERLRLLDEEKSFRIYLTDVVRGYGNGMTLTERWIDLIERPRDFDPDAITDSVIARAELLVDNEHIESSGIADM